jgi:hypothetical protein
MRADRFGTLRGTRCARIEPPDYMTALVPHLNLLPKEQWRVEPVLDCRPIRNDQ